MKVAVLILFIEQVGQRWMPVAVGNATYAPQSFGNMLLKFSMEREKKHGRILKSSTFNHYENPSVLFTSQMLSGRLFHAFFGRDFDRSVADSKPLNIWVRTFKGVHFESLLGKEKKKKCQDSEKNFSFIVSTTMEVLFTWQRLSGRLLHGFGAEVLTAH